MVFDSGGEDSDLVCEEGDFRLGRNSLPFGFLELFFQMFICGENRLELFPSDRY